MAADSTPSAYDLIDNLSPETVAAIAQVDDECADTMRALLQSTGLNLFVQVFDIIRPAAQA